MFGKIKQMPSFNKKIKTEFPTKKEQANQVMPPMIKVTTRLNKTVNK